MLTQLYDFRQIAAAQEGVEPGAVDKPFRQPDHQPARSPVGEIEMQVEPALHEPLRIALEVAPFIVIGETRGRNPRPRRQRP